MNMYFKWDSFLLEEGRNGNTFLIANIYATFFIPKENNQWSGNILQEKDTYAVGSFPKYTLKFLEEVKIGRKKPNLIKRNEIYFLKGSLQSNFLSSYYSSFSI